MVGKIPTDQQRKWWLQMVVTGALQMVGKIPTAQQRKFPQLNKENSHSSSSASVNLGQNPDPGTHFTPQLSTKLNTNEVINAYIACIF